MSTSPSDVESDPSRGAPHFQDAELKVGAVYAIGVETAVARLPLLLAPLQAALQAGRPCVLITRLPPEEAAFADVLAHARQMVEATCGVAADRLQVFTAVGDYSVNLFLHGAERYLQELEQFAIAPGSVLVIDEADDLYTPHDHGAVVQQARAYRAWCEKHQHTMVQLHLRTSAHHPLLEGNQAAAQYLSGIARAISHPDGLRMVIEFWESSAGMQTGRSIPLNPLLPSFAGAGAMNGAAVAFTTNQSPAPGTAGPARRSLWYVGPPEGDLGAWSRQFDVHRASSLAELLPWRHSCGDPIIIASLGSLDGFSGFVEQLAELRSTVGSRARIVVRESRYRLREHTQKRLLLRAGVDSVLTPRQSLSELVPELLQPRPQPLAAVTDADLYAAVPWVLDAPDADPASLGSSAFLEEAERRLKRSMSWRVPCALAEVDYEFAQAPERVNGTTLVPVSRRAGDLITGKPGTQYFFLQGCHVHDAMQVVMRGMEEVPRARMQRIRLYTSEMAIADRFLQLRNEAIADAMMASVSQGKAATNVVTMPANGRTGQPWGHVSMAVLAALLSAAVSGDARAQAEPAAPAGAAPAAAAASVSYEQGRYEQVARQGLIELQREPSDHGLRLKVANSLAWTGQYREAIQQYELLAGTPVGLPAGIGLANVYLWSGRPHLADPLFRRALASEPSNADALQGLARAQRQLRPRTTVRGEWLDDSSQTERSTAAVTHRWRDAGLTQIFEVSGEKVDETRSPNGLALRPRKLSLGYQNLGLPLAPKLRLTSDSGVKSSLYGNLALQLADGAATVEYGRVNWGEIAFDPRARRDGLSARRLGLAGRADSAVGSFSGSAAHFDVSDGNRVQEYSAQYTPAWQPLPAASGVRVVGGVYGRKAKLRDPRYWSPASYYIGQLGLSLNRSAEDWDLSAEVKRGLRIGGDGAQGWTIGFAGTRWLSSQWALRLEGFHIETRRDNSAYRSKSVALSLDRVW